MVFDFLGDLADLFSGGSDAGDAVDAASGGGHAASDVHFGEGRWDNGTDHNNYPVAQSSTGPPYYTGGPNQGQPVDPKDVTWH